MDDGCNKTASGGPLQKAIENKWSDVEPKLKSIAPDKVAPENREEKDKEYVDKMIGAAMEMNDSGKLELLGTTLRQLRNANRNLKATENA